MVGYIKTVLIPVLLVSVLSSVICYVIWKLMPPTLLYNTLFMITSLVVCIMVTAYIGLTMSERQIIISGLRKIARKVN